MNLQEVSEIYKEILEQNNGTKIARFDLHVHSPASYDYDNQNKSEEECYLSILEQALKHNLKIIAITDHNTFNGYNQIEKLKKVHEQYKELLVLCGIEITCFSKHLLAIFNEDFPEVKQNNFLRKIGIADGEEMADLYGPAKLIEIIGEFGGFALLAHADAEDGFLLPLCKNKGNKKGAELEFTGQSLRKILQSEYLYGIQFTNHHNRKKIQEKFKNYTYKNAGSQLGFYQFSDSHGMVVNNQYAAKSGKPIGEVFSLAKLSSISFEALKMALKDHAMRIIEKEEEKNYPYIIGAAIDSNFLKKDYNNYTLISFHPEMNCIIGGRGTGKSTILQIILYILKFGRDKEIGHIKDRFSEAIIYIHYNERVYAIYYSLMLQMDSYVSDQYINTSKLKIYTKKENNNKFEIVAPDVENAIILFIGTGYMQGDLSKFQRDPNNILSIVEEFLKWKKSLEYEKNKTIILKNSEKLKDIFDEYEVKRETKELKQFLKDEDYLDKIILHHNIVSKAKDREFVLYRNMIDELNGLLRGKVKLELSKCIKKEDREYLIKHFPRHVKNIANEYYEYEIKIRNLLKRVIDFITVKAEFDFFLLLFNGNIEQVIKAYNLSSIENIEKILQDIKRCIAIDELYIVTDLEIKMEYNIHAGNIEYPAVFRNSQQISMGQNSVALLLLILNASHNLGDNRTLLMDQPEDDLDNSYIFNTLVNEFRKSKAIRQIIISTHNANIPVASDSENILVLKYDGQHGYIGINGALDNDNIVQEVLNNLEGGSEAIKQRFDKYKFFQEL